MVSSVHAIAGLHAQRAEQRRMFPIPFCVSIGHAFLHQINAVLNGQRREILQDLVPMRFARQPSRSRQVCATRKPNRQ